MIRLGSTVTDSISGFTGVVVGRVEYLTGCNQCLVQPKVGSDGKMADSHWFDEQRLKWDGGELVALDNGKSPGFDKSAPTR